MGQVNKTQQSRIDDTTELLTKGENRGRIGPRWAAAIGIIALGFIYLALPDKLRIGPSWLLLAIEAVLLIPIIFFHGHFSQTTIRTLALILLGILTAALAGIIVLLILTLSSSTKGVTLLRSAGLIWFFNIIVFALWYWEIDGGGPLKRHMSGHKAADFMFPQQADGNTGNWVPHFIDYLFVAFTGATALSPADTYPLTRTAKMLMMIEAVLSMTVIILLAARAVNIL
jgi:hypothetical protein